jgi:apolipoprotein D and lipocalin family protein
MEVEGKEKVELTVVKQVDLNRYMGVWYEIAKIPNKFQKKCEKNTTARYTLREDGRVDVVNRCERIRRSAVVARGIAKIIDNETKAKLKVSFVKLLGNQVFWGDYWIIGLAEDYRYAVVGEPSRKYGWILGRSPVFSEEDWSIVREILKSQGYDPARFVKTDHDAAE